MQGLVVWIRDADDELLKLPLQCETRESAGWMHFVGNAGLGGQTCEEREIRPWVARPALRSMSETGAINREVLR
jgi:hypothetical protein